VCVCVLVCLCVCLCMCARVCYSASTASLPHDISPAWAGVPRQHHPPSLPPTHTPPHTPSPQSSGRGPTGLSVGLNGHCQSLLAQCLPPCSLTLRHTVPLCLSSLLTLLLD